VISIVRQTPTRNTLAGMLAALARRHRVPGAQLALHLDGDTIAVEVGEIRAGGLAVTRDTAFPIGSIGKSFTATVAMILVADGDLELDEPIGEHLPELDEPVGRLTLRQLLSHTSGLAANPPDAADGVSLRRFASDHCGRESIIFTPGSAFSYSNPGYMLVGRLIEAVTGMTWAEATESILLRPLRITPAFIREPGHAARRPIATGHSANVATGRVRPVEQAIQPAEVPAGGLAASALDLVTFGLAHIDGTGPLPAAEAEQMRRPVPEADPFGLADGWGLGLATFRHDTTTWAGHDGNADGTACYVRFDADSRAVLSLTTNANTGIGLWRELQEWLGREGLPIGPATPAPGRRPLPAPSSCTAIYKNAEVEYVVRPGHDGGVYLAVDGDVPERVTVYEGLTFWLQDAASGRHEFGGRFVRDPKTGEIAGLQMGGRLAPKCARPVA
jgi:CubicO group peptidase (beta-lactamase class C family)